MYKYSILVASFPFGDGVNQTKPRPVLCLSNSIGKYEELILAYITSKIPFEKLESDVTIQKTDEFFNQTGLSHSSTIRLHKLISLSKTEILGTLGVLPFNVQLQVNMKLNNLFK
jgi:mRNA interferase MazF